MPARAPDSGHDDRRSGCGRPADAGNCRTLPDLDAEDVTEALLFATEAVRERVLPLAAGE